VAVAGAVLTSAARAQQVPDTLFNVSIPRPAYPKDKGPVVAIDAAHHNFHTAGGRYRTFADVLRADGYRVRENQSPFSKAVLDSVSVLVIANAGTDAQSSWALPTHSAFKKEEVDALEAWVRTGGALFLIADHMPAAGSMAGIARRFGVEFTNGYTRQNRPDRYPGDLFTRADSSVIDHPVTRGRGSDERIDSVVTFTGQAFQITGSNVAVVLRFGPTAYTLLPVVAGRSFDSTTPEVYSGRWPHAATVKAGRGRVAMFGEAAMFSAQRAGPNGLPMGMNHPLAARNKQLLLNAIHWLTGLID
jgi:hypothetical protein